MAEHVKVVEPAVVASCTECEWRVAGVSKEEADELFKDHWRGHDEPPPEASEMPPGRPALDEAAAQRRAVVSEEKEKP